MVVVVVRGSDYARDLKLLSHSSSPYARRCPPYGDSDMPLHMMELESFRTFSPIPNLVSASSTLKCT